MMHSYGDNELGKSTLLKVLILVVMDDALVQCESAHQESRFES